VVVGTAVRHGDFSIGSGAINADATGRAAAGDIPNSILLEYQGAPHGLFATHRERLVKDLLAFLKQ